MYLPSREMCGKSLNMRTLISNFVPLGLLCAGDLSVTVITAVCFLIGCYNLSLTAAHKKGNLTLVYLTVAKIYQLIPEC